MDLGLIFKHGVTNFGQCCKKNALVKRHHIYSFKIQQFFKSLSKEKCLYCCKQLWFFLLGTPRYQTSENLQTYIFLRHLLVKRSRVILHFPNQSKGYHTVTHILKSPRLTRRMPSECKRLTVTKYLIHRFLP